MDFRQICKRILSLDIFYFTSHGSEEQWTGQKPTAGRGSGVGTAAWCVPFTPSTSWLCWLPAWLQCHSKSNMDILNWQCFQIGAGIHPHPHIGRWSWWYQWWAKDFWCSWIIKKGGVTWGLFSGGYLFFFLSFFFF